jgi:RhtB (resistance to homoserine/threonine) family protein
MLIDYLPSFLTLTVIQMLGVMSPGPDFAVVMRNSLIYTRKIGVLTAIGVSLGILVHLAYILLGVGVAITKTPWLFYLFKYCGAAYLMYIGIKGLLVKTHVQKIADSHEHLRTISSFAALRTGFFTNAINPKAMLFFLSLLPAFITPSKPNLVIAIYGGIIISTTLIWFTCVAVCFSNQRLRSFFDDHKHIVERVTGGLLILLGIKILFTNLGS